MTRLLLPFLLIGPTLLAEDFKEAEDKATKQAEEALKASTAEVTEADLKNYVTRLASREYEGRGTGLKGERMATAYLAAFFKGLELNPAGDKDSFYQNFTFKHGLTYADKNTLEITLAEPLGLVRRFSPGSHYEPLSISTSATVDAGVVFAGYGIEMEEYNSYEGLDVKGKWVIVLRGHPGDDKKLARQGPMIVKANNAKKREAAGIIYVKGTNPKVSRELVPPTRSVGGGQAMPAISITDSLAVSLLTGQGDIESLRKLYQSYNKKERTKGFSLPYQIKAEIGITPREISGRNVIARLQAGDEPSAEAIVVGGHIDHLGFGNRGGSRAQGTEADQLHYGADDNATGVAVVMELAQYFQDLKKAGKLNHKRDLIFAGWSGEEMGLHGSKHYVAELKKSLGEDLHPKICAYLNLDMVGRARQGGLIVQGLGSSRAWPSIMDELEEVPGLNLKKSPNPHMGTDTVHFYNSKIPVIGAFTGSHDDYHTPRDTVATIDFPGLTKICNFYRILAAKTAEREHAPDYLKFDRQMHGLKIKIGIRIDEVKDGGGIRVTETIAESPAARAELKPEDVIIKVDKDEVKNRDTFFKALKKLKPEEEYDFVIKRGEEEKTLRLKPEKK